ncbi:MAG: ABC transporter permease [Alkalispirochaeta sp.]
MSSNPAQQTAPKRGEARKVAGQVLQKLAAFLSLVLMVIFFSIGSPFFLSVNNLMTIILQSSVLGILAIGVTLVIVGGGIDLSVGSVLAFSGMMIGVAVNAGVPLVLSILFGVFAGAFMGMVSGFLVSRAHMPPFIATLGMMMIARGLTLVVSDARPVYFLETPAFPEISQGMLFGVVPYPVLYVIGVAIISSFVLKKLAIGRYIYALGSNEEAASLSGINVKNVKLFVYTYSGLLAGIAGLVLASRLSSAQPMAGLTNELQAIAAAVIGGTSLSGGVGTITGTLIGAVLMGVLRNGLNLMNVSQFWQEVAMGVVVIVAVYIDIMRQERGFD